jgi:hypothetical protein
MFIINNNKIIMKLQIIPTIKQGFEVTIKNPIILTIIVLNAFFSYILNFLLISYLSKFLELSEYFWFIIIIFILLVSIFLTLIIVKMVYGVIMNNNVLLSETVNLSIKRFIPVFIANILYFLILVFGFITLIVPGIFLFIKFTFVTHFILLNNEKIINSFKKSWQVTKGSWWQIFGLF